MNNPVPAEVQPRNRLRKTIRRLFILSDLVAYMLFLLLLMVAIAFPFIARIEADMDRLEYSWQQSVLVSLFALILAISAWATTRRIIFATGLTVALLLGYAIFSPAGRLIALALALVFLLPMALAAIDYRRGNKSALPQRNDASRL